eukprot:gi/632936171/ref/XP_007892731.1/ PREDICTED: uncharacterized protein LOC103179323 [Callorhinchus milii]
MDDSVRKSRASLFANLCLTLSALWCGSGLVHLLVGQRVVAGEAAVRDALVPGLLASALGLLLLAAASLLAGRAVLSGLCLALALALAHRVASLYRPAFGGSAAAACYLIAACLGLYAALSRGLKPRPGGGGGVGGVKPESGESPALASGHLLNVLSAAVFGCRVLGITSALSVGQVPWLWTAAALQLGLCVMAFRAADPLWAAVLGLTATLKAAEGYSLLLPAVWPEAAAAASASGTGLLTSPASALALLAALFLALALLTAALRGPLQAAGPLSFVAYSLAVAAARPASGFLHGGPQGTSLAVLLVAACLALVHLWPGGFPARLTGARASGRLVAALSGLKLRRPEDSRAPRLGYARYSEAESLAHACSALAAFALVSPGVVGVSAAGPLTLPWVVVPGGAVQLLCGSIAFSRGKTLESSAFVLYGAMWVVWGLTRFGGLYGTARGFRVSLGIVCFLLSNCFVVVGAVFLNKMWLAFSLAFQLVLISFLLDAVGANPYGYDVGVGVVFGLVSFYCFLATLFNQSFESPRMPVGSPLVKLSGYRQPGSECPHLQSRKASSVAQIAEIMKNGGACGIPTDTVYVLVAACNRPDAVEKAYNTKKQAKERPMSLWISNLSQLEPAKHLFSPLLWDFMHTVWPSSISLVIPRGQWLDCFGLKNAAKYIGTPQSIAIRIPDCAVTTHLIDQVGPIAVTSANPTGEADTTHHNQVYSKLGNKVDGVLCDGPSPENIASTVVDCTKMESGTLGFFRVGLVPKSEVLQLFEKVQKRHMNGLSNGSFSHQQPDLDTTPQQPHKRHSPNATYENQAFAVEEYDEKI